MTKWLKKMPKPGEIYILNIQRFFFTQRENVNKNCDGEIYKKGDVLIFLKEEKSVFLQKIFIFYMQKQKM